MTDDPAFHIVLATVLRRTLGETRVEMVQAHAALAEVRMNVRDDTARRYHVRLGLTTTAPFRRP
ncbi:MAG: hypothetical protein EOQ97_11275 [Mesorhizobium sp.]|nr:MAG: hypothetical protein EOQ97_11275 [Mesorhizobium sp.]